MNLGVFEARLIEALRERLPGSPSVQAGPAYAGPATGVRPEAFVHVARFHDLGGTTADGAVIGRLPWQGADGVSGFAEDRPARVEIDIAFVGALLWQAQLLAGLAATTLLKALETLAGASLGDPSDPLCSLRFTDHRAALHCGRVERHKRDGVAVHHAVLTLRLDGCLQVRVTAPPGGLVRDSAHAALAPSVEVCLTRRGRSATRACAAAHRQGDLDRPGRLVDREHRTPTAPLPLPDARGAGAGRPDAAVTRPRPRPRRCPEPVLGSPAGGMDEHR
jgi:hypothetical protein